MTKLSLNGPWIKGSPAARGKVFENHFNMAALSDLERIQQELAEARRALVEAEHQRQQQQHRADRAEQDREQERQRAEQAEQRQQQAEQERQQAEQERQQAEQERQYERQRNQPTTLDEFLEGCHVYISKPLTVQTDRSLSTGGGITRPNNKHYPQRLRQWTHLPDTQARLFHPLHDVFHPASEPPLRLFDPMIHLEVLGPKLCDRPLASEADLQLYERPAVEQPVMSVISALRDASPEGRFDVGDGIIFESHPNTLSDMNEEVQQRRQRRQGGGGSTDSNMRPKNTDQICVYRDISGRRTPLLIVEYKPPHKLSIGDLLWGLREDMSIPKVIERDTIPTDLKERSEHNSDEAVAAVLTQTFHYMIQCGLEYSYITTGEAFVFLRIKEEDPTTLYYHFTAPKEEADMDEDPQSRVLRTAVGQVLSFCLLAMKSQQRSKEWQARAYRLLEKWPVSRVFRETPQSERVATPPASEFKMRLRLLTPRSFGLRRRSGGRATCAEGEAMSNDDDSDEDFPDIDNTPSKAGRGPSKHGSSVSATSIGSPDTSRTRTQPHQSQQSHKSRQYCTQACLLGLKRGHVLDQNCPNISSHLVGQNGNRHAIEIETFTALVREQLARNLDRDCEPLSKQGARGALFKITLSSHGYTFVSKGTVSVFVPDLLHESRIYQRLDAMQGEMVPVHLGNINLVRKYDLDLGVRIGHMLLMSWGGETADQADMPNLKEEVVRLVDDLRVQGVIHNDVRAPNILWNAERRRPMLIDFERSTVSSSGADFVGVKPLQEISPNRKRKRAAESKAISESADAPFGAAIR